MSESARPSVLVTGAPGFVGSAIVAYLRARAVQVIPTGRGVPSTADADYRTLDVLDSDAIGDALRGADVVIHAAGLAHRFRRTRDLPFMRINAQGTENVARAAARSGTAHFVLLSSVSVYGPTGAAVVAEGAECRPDTPYAKSKLEAERRAEEVAAACGMRLTILRLATVYGEGDKGNIARLVRAIDRRRFVWVGAGENRKSLIHCDDVARACAAILGSGEPPHRIYNVSGPASTLREIVTGICDALDRPLPGWRIPAGVARTAARTASALALHAEVVERYSQTLEKWLADNVYDVTRFARDCGFEPRVALRDGLRREVEWYRNGGTLVR